MTPASIWVEAMFRSEQRRIDRNEQRFHERSSESGWALIGLLMALGVMSIFLTSAIIPNIQKEVQRDKEAELMYRGQQMAEGIARYYGRGRLVPLNILMPPTPLPYLTELAKLRDGVNIGVREIKFVRPSAMIDPMSNTEWEPVRARDPRIMKFLQAWAAETLSQIPYSYRVIAAPPPPSAFKNSGSSTSQTGSATQGQGTSQNPTNPANPAGSEVTAPRRPATSDDNDDDDDDDDDPLAHLFDTESPGHSNAPIVGVAPKRKGPAMNTYFGLSNYEEWIFLYIPKILPPGTVPIQQGPPTPNNPRRRVSQ
jgi:type II secretory pathway pseudopilin PulG